MLSHNTTETKQGLYILNCELIDKNNTLTEINSELKEKCNALTLKLDIQQRMPCYSNVLARTSS